jgi:hypothetical protein
MCFSVGLCDVDEKGVQYMLLCRMILGNMEAVELDHKNLFQAVRYMILVLMIVRTQSVL